MHRAKVKEKNWPSVSFVQLLQGMDDMLLALQLAVEDDSWPQRKAASAELDALPLPFPLPAQSASARTAEAQVSGNGAAAELAQAALRQAKQVALDLVNLRQNMAGLGIVLADYADPAMAMRKPLLSFR